MILANKLNITDQIELARVKRRLQGVNQRNGCSKRHFRRFCEKPAHRLWQ